MKVRALFSIVLILNFPLLVHATMTDKQTYAASMENDAQFIECVGNIFLGIANFQRVILPDLKWEPKNPEFEKLQKSKASFAKASGNLSAALDNSDRLLGELSKKKKLKFEKQLLGFKTQVQDLKLRLDKIVEGLDQKHLPPTQDIHRLVELAIAGTGFGMEISRKNDDK